VFAIIGAWPMVFRREDPRLWAVVLAALLILPALVYPRSLKWAYRVWMAIGHVLAWINTRIILGIIFFGLFTPVGFIMRLFGWDPLRRRSDRKAASYRLVREPRPDDHMKHQF
jgi:hypothetical protein